MLRSIDNGVPEGGAEYSLFNLDSGLRVAGTVRVANDSASRRKGLLGVYNLDNDSGLWIMPCEAIHTFGMKIAIDVLFLDRGLKVKKVVREAPPRRVSFCLLASSVVEVRAGAISHSKTKVGDRLVAERRFESCGFGAPQTANLDSICRSY